MPMANLVPLLGSLAPKYVRTRAEFVKKDQSVPIELRKSICHWAVRDWFHRNPWPTSAQLRSFDVMSLEPEYRKHVERYGDRIQEVGLTIEEGNLASGLLFGCPHIFLLSTTFQSEPHSTIEDLRLWDPDELVWLCGMLCLFTKDPTMMGQPVCVSDGRIGHIVSITGINSLSYHHPRGIQIEPGWISFHDPWPARSLLAVERDFAGVHVIEDVSRPPHWLISPKDLERIVVGIPLNADWVPAYMPLFKALDILRSTKAPRPLWNERWGDVRGWFALAFAMEGPSPTTVQSLVGLARVAWLQDDAQFAFAWLDAGYKTDGSKFRHAMKEVLPNLGVAELGISWERHLREQ